MLGANKVKLEKNQRQGVMDKLIADTQPNIGFIGLAAISSLIATFALLIEDIPVLVGAMLIAPFLTPTLLIGMGIIRGELNLLKKGLITLLAGIVIGIIFSVIITLISPIKEIGDEIMTRSSPTLIQLFIAVLAGGAAAFSYSYRKIRAVLAGAFIALALVPPISIIGIGIATWNLEILGGASLLLTANVIGLTIASVAVFFLLGFRPRNTMENLRGVKLGIIWLAVLFFLIALPLGYIMQNIIDKVQIEDASRKVISRQLNKYPDSEVTNISSQEKNGKVKISFTIQSGYQIDNSLIAGIRNSLEDELNKEVEVDAKLIPTFRIDY